MTGTIIADGRNRGCAPQSRFTLRDWIAGAVLFAATASVILWQNAHVAVLFDLSYILNTAERIAAGQIPYRDFALPHAPLTFLVQAAIIRLTGRVYFHHVLYVAAVGGLSTCAYLADRAGHFARAHWRRRGWWRCCLPRLSPWWGSIASCPAPSTTAIARFWILVTVWGLHAVEREPRPGDKDKNFARLRHSDWNWLPGLLAGVVLCVPLFCKQNMGLPFLLAAVCAILLVSTARWTRRRSDVQADGFEMRGLMAALAGAAVALAAAALALHWTAGLGNYIRWTIAYAGQRRLPGLGAMLSVYAYPALVWMLPCVVAGLLLLRYQRRAESHLSDKSKDVAKVGHHLWLQIAAFLLLAAPFLFALAALFIYDDADSRGDSLLMHLAGGADAWRPCWR